MPSSTAPNCLVGLRYWLLKRLTPGPREIWHQETHDRVQYICEIFQCQATREVTLESGPLETDRCGCQLTYNAGQYNQQKQVIIL